QRNSRARMLWSIGWNADEPHSRTIPCPCRFHRAGGQLKPWGRLCQPLTTLDAAARMPPQFRQIATNDSSLLEAPRFLHGVSLRLVCGREYQSPRHTSERRRPARRREGCIESETIGTRHPSVGHALRSPNVLVPKSVSGACRAGSSSLQDGTLVRESQPPSLLLVTDRCSREPCDSHTERSLRVPGPRRSPESRLRSAAVDLRIF